MTFLGSYWKIMKKNELKNILKPLIKQCIKEVLFEEGVLSGIISEVVKGTSQNQVIQAAPPPKREIREEEKKEYSKKLNETKQKMLDVIGKGSYGDVNLFEGTEPLSSAGKPGAGGSPTSPLSNFSPGDSGVDISGIFGSMSNNWKKMI